MLHLFILRQTNAPLGLGAPMSCSSIMFGHLKSKKANHDASKLLKCAGIARRPSRWSWFQYDTELILN
ncbi:MAG: hypothetical protein EZS28_011543 [Streblomastix strix]|uniref:Uncharacterized protein n=1 Tax=Streblomastix strix TaxID=222440 RepID=A0A5J4WEE7_9EUKA|nr:MAG: hypothetical protein EZS28_011543 [Streblomastix strix]